MMNFVDAKPLDMLDRWFVRVMLLLVAVFCTWLTFDTRRALTRMVQFTTRWSPLGGRWSINPEKAGWIWFYRIDSAVVLAGVAWRFAQHYLAR